MVAYRRVLYIGRSFTRGWCLFDFHGECGVAELNFADGKQPTISPPGIRLARLSGSVNAAVAPSPAQFARADFASRVAPVSQGRIWSAVWQVAHDWTLRSRTRSGSKSSPCGLIRSPDFAE